MRRFHLLLAFVVSGLVLAPSVGFAMPLPPKQRGVDAKDLKGPIKVKVRRIDKIEPISTTAPPPRGGLSGEHKVLVVMVSTRDLPFAAEHDQEFFRKRFFAQDEPSLAHYYQENSYGRYRVSGDVIGPYRIPGRLRDYSYGQGGDNSRVRELVKAAFATAAHELDLSEYDRFNQFGQPGKDGIVDHFAVVVPAQRGDPHAAIFAPIWPHRGTFQARSNGFRLGSYFVSSAAAPLGTYVHEFGHDIGLPDLYDRDDSSHGVGEWCAMGSGSWLDQGAKPSHLSAWAKVRLGWIRPTSMTRARARVQIPAAETTPFAIRIPIGRIDSKEYFLLENRQQVGYDEKLPDHGLLIWHIDESVDSNDDEAVRLVDVEEPAVTQDLDVMLRNVRPDHQDTFRAGRRDTFDARSDPSSLTNAGRKTGVAITSISRSTGVMLADFDVPTVRDPGGEPHRLIYDNYNYGTFSNVGLGSGGEKLVRFETTTGGYEIHGFEALLMSNPRTQGDLTVRVYDGTRSKPGAVKWSKRVSVTFRDDSYAWLKVRVEDPERLRLRGGQTFWVGFEHHDAATGLAHNPNSTSKRSRFRMKRSAQLRNTFGPGREVPDFILRVDGYGHLGSRAVKKPEATESDSLVQQMRRHDGQLDAKDFAGATRGYREVLASMERSPERYVTWIPVLHNSLGVAAYQAKDYPTAIDFFERSLRRAQQHGDARAEADILENLGETHFHSGDYELAADYCRRSEALNADRPGRLIENKYWQGRIAYARGQIKEARTILDQVMPLVEVVHAASTDEKRRWSARVSRARSGVAKGEDLDGAPSRLAQEHSEERAIEKGEMKEEDSAVWRIDLADFGLEGFADVE